MLPRCSTSRPEAGRSFFSEVRVFLALGLFMLLWGGDLRAQPGPVSDDFNGTALNTSLWTLVAPAGGTVSVSNGHANLTATGGSNHDAFVGGNNSVRIVQTIANSDFEVAAKFDSAPTALYEGEGILVQQDSGTYMRVEFGYDGSGLIGVFANIISGGSQKSLFFSSFGAGAASLWLQVQRTGNNWVVSYSTNGATFTQAGSFSQTLSVSAIGVYADNWSGTPSQAPAFTAAVDFFHNLGATTVATPTFNPPSGTSFSSTLSVSIADATSGATIYYTTDGSTPTTSSAIYGGPITLSQSTTIKAFATLTGDNPSAVASASYIQSVNTAATPTFNPPSGTSFSSTLSVSIADATSGATIYYTTDGSTPTTSSTVYTGPITISQSTTIKAFAAASGDNPSAVASASYTETVAAGAPVSDDFNGSALNTSLWTLVAPAGGTVSVSNGHANLTAPGGSNHDAFVGGNNSVRIVQAVGNADFDVAAKFDSAPTTSYEGEGILVQQDSGTYMRIELGYGGSGRIIAFASIVSAGAQKTLASSTFSAGAASLWLQVQRTGNSWVVSYSTDGTTFIQVGSFSQTLNVSTLGLYADNYGSPAPAFTAAADFFHNLSSTSVATPTFNPPSGTSFSSTLSVSIADTTSGATIYYTTDGSTPTTSSAIYGGPITISQSTTFKAFAAAAGDNPSAVASASYTQSVNTVATPTFIPPSGTSFSSTLSVSIADNTSGATIYYTTDGSTPTASSTVYTGPITISQSTTIKAFAAASGDNPSPVASASYTQSVTAGSPVSDDFNGTALNTNLWTLVAPAGGTVSVSNGHANLTAPGGSNHDAFVGGDNSVRIVQAVANADFEVAAKFDSAPTVTYEGEGILVQQDSGTYMRIEFGYGGSGRIIAFASIVSAGAQTTLASSTFSAGAASLWLQVQRTGNAWVISYSTNGTTFTQIGSFSQTLNVSAIGLYADNYSGTPSQAPAFTAAVDFFHNISNVSGPPVISNIAANPSSTGAAITWTTDQASTTLVNYGTTTSYGSTSSNSALVTSHSATLSGLTCNTTYDYEVLSTNAGGQTSSSNNLTFTTGSCSTGGGPVSDSFDSPVLNSALWTFVNPLGDGVLTMNGTAATISIPWGSNHESGTTGNGAVRLMQNISNSDFQVQVRFQSTVAIGDQDEGILVQQDASDFLRFDVLNDGTAIRLFAEGVNGSNATVFVNNVINVPQAPIWLQLQRSGNNWVGKWSLDGVNFAVATTFTFTMNVSSIGPYAANFNATASNAPAFTAIVDYFFNVASPLPNQDGPAPFQAITVDANPPAPVVEKALLDILGTGHLDPVIGSESPGPGGIYWYEYPASGILTDTWIKHTIVSSGNAYEDMLPLDVNNDGAVDLVASYLAPGSSTFHIVWFENPRGTGGDPRTSPWVMHTIGTGMGEDNLVIADLDGDGKPDIATSFYIYFQNSPTSWTQVQYNSSFRGSALLDIGTGRGSINLVGSASTGTMTNNVVWFENPRETGGNARTGKWIPHTIGPSYACNANSCPGGDYSVAAYNSGDFNSDGRMDVVMGQSEGVLGVPPPPGGLIWFEAPADRINGTWIRHTIDASFIDSHCVRVADMDHNGTLDLVSSEQDQAILRRVSVFYNDGAGNFTEQILSNGAGHQTTIGNVRGNGAIDILNSAHGYGGLIKPIPLLIFLNPVP